MHMINIIICATLLGFPLGAFLLHRRKLRAERRENAAKLKRFNMTAEDLRGTREVTIVE